MDLLKISSALIILIVSQYHVVSEDPFRLYILHTNDIHSRFEMFNKNELVCKDETSTEEDKKCYGGVVRRAGFVNEFRKKHENVLLLDAGDQFQGSPWFFTYKGVEASHFLNLLGYDAMALGNHEFDNGVNGLIPFLKNLTVPILCANLNKDDKVPDQIRNSVKDSLILERGGRKIGVIGYITDSVPTLSQTGNLTFNEEYKVIEEIAEKLKGEGVDIIIALGHSGIRKDKEMAEKLKNVDVIVGGHSHSLLYTGANPAHDEVAGDYPLVYKHNGDVTLVVQAGTLGKYVGVLNLTFDSQGKLLSWSGNPVPIDTSVPEDAATKVEMEKLEKNVSSIFSEVVGHSDVTLDASENKCRIKECNIGNLYTDALVAAVQEIKHWNNLTIGMASGGSYRASLSKGPITYADVISVLPFGSDLDIVILDGSTIVEMLEHSVKGFDLKEKQGKFLQMSGMKVKYNMAKPDGSRVEKVEVVNCYQCKDYSPLDKNKKYPAILSDYIVSGGDGFKMVAKYKEDAISMDLQDSAALVAYFKKHSPINAKVEGRISGLETFPGWEELAKDDVAEKGDSVSITVNIAVMVLSFVTSLTLRI